MPLNPNRPVNTVIEGAIQPNEDGLWAIFDGDEELTYWQDGQAIEVLRNDEWLQGRVVRHADHYDLQREDGSTLQLLPGDVARRRVGGSI